MFAVVMMSNAWSGFAVTPTWSVALLAIVVGISLVVDRLATHRAMAATVSGICLLVAAFAIRKFWLGALIYYWDHYWFWGCFC